MALKEVNDRGRFERLHGSTARIWRYCISLRRFELRIFNGIPGWNVNLFCYGAQSIVGPTEWSDPRLEVEFVRENQILLRDPWVGFEAHVETFAMGENHIHQKLGRGIIREYPHLGMASDPRPLLERWKGASGCIDSYEPFARSLELRAGWSPSRLRILCVGVDWFSGPTKWEEADFEIERLPDGRYAVRDRAAGLEVRAEVLRVHEVADDLYQSSQLLRIDPSTAMWNAATLSLESEFPDGSGRSPLE